MLVCLSFSLKRIHCLCFGILFLWSRSLPKLKVSKRWSRVDNARWTYGLVSVWNDPFWRITLIWDLEIWKVSIGCKHNLTCINNYLKTAFLCAPFRQTHNWLCAKFHRRRSAYAVRQWMDACGGTSYMEESSSNISSYKQPIWNQRGMMKYGYLLYVHDELVTSMFPASQYIRLSMRCLPHQRVDHKRFPAWISVNSGSTWIIQKQFDVWHDHPTFRQSQRQYDSVLRII